MPRIIAIDYGTKRTGIAVSDPTRTIASPLETIPTHTLREWLKNYIPANDVGTIVVGLPTQMDGSPSAITPQIEALVRWLRQEFPTHLIARADERFTSQLAHRAMLDGGLRQMARRDKALVDRISAAIILQSYLDSPQGS